MELTSQQVLDLARDLDAAHSFAFHGATEDIDGASRAAVAIMVAGFVSGGCEVILADVAEGHALYETAREMGRDAALKAKAARG